MRDSTDRSVRYLRISVTSRCGMRCLYCRPASYRHHAREELTADEIEQLVGRLVRQHQIDKVRLTGGEPTARGDLIDIVRRLASIEPMRELTMTTHGLTLAQHARQLASAGLTRVNVSLDSIRAPRFHELTGVDGLARVIDGIDAAQSAGLTPVRLNTVVVRGHNDEELPDLVGFAADRGCEIRFIELMPMGPLADRWADRYVPAAQMRRTLDRVIESWDAAPPDHHSAQRYAVKLRDGRHQTIGLITAMSSCFCDRCDRLRIGADGTIYPCLMDQSAGSLLPALRPGFDPELFDQLLHDAMAQKPTEHPAVGATVMTQMGG